MIESTLKNITYMLISCLKMKFFFSFLTRFWLVVRVQRSILTIEKTEKVYIKELWLNDIQANSIWETI